MIVGDTTGLNSLIYAGKPILPERDSYSVRSQGGIVQSDIQGGLSKQHVQFVNAPFTVNVTYKGLDQSKSFYLQNFFDENRGRKFIATLLVGGIENEEFVVQRIGDYSYKPTGFSGEISLTLQVQPGVDRCFTSWASEAFQCVSGADWSKIFCYASKGVESLPSYFGPVFLSTGLNWAPLSENLKILEEFKDEDSNKIKYESTQDVSFTRSTTGTYISGGVLKTADIDEPRFEADGLLCFGSYTNLSLWSEDFSMPSWAKSGGAVAYQDGTLSPDGISEAWAVENAISTTGNIQQRVDTPDVGESVTMSWFAKRGTSQYAKLRWISYISGVTQDYQATFDFDSGEFTNINPSASVSSVKLIDEWVLLTITSTRNNTGNTSLRLDIAPDGLGTIYVWGSSVILSAQDLPYIRTEQAPVTSGSDLASMPVIGTMPTSGSPFEISFSFNKKYVTPPSFLFETSVSNSSQDAFGVYIQGGNLIARTRINSIDTSYQISSSQLGDNDFKLKYDGNSITCIVNGTTSNKINLIMSYQNDLNVNLGSNRNGGQQLVGHIRNLKITKL